MCGIAGYVGVDATETVLNMLKPLEYRGYDSAGIAVCDKNEIQIFKTKGTLEVLEKFISENGSPKGNCAIGHTRWATHGKPSDTNSHPHNFGNVTLVHNGIIENYAEIKAKLQSEGKAFVSQTDSEVAAALLDILYNGAPLETITAFSKAVRGSFALAIMFSDRPDEIYAVRHDSPLVIGVKDSESFLASDISAFLPYTQRYFLLEEGEIAVIKKEGITVFSIEGKEISKNIIESDLKAQAASKNGFKHFMLKEIYEQPQTIKDTLCSKNITVFSKISAPSKIHVVACGTAMYAGLVGKSVIEKLCKIPVEVCVASEFRYNEPILEKDDLAIFVSQSGETADTLASLRLAKQKGVRTLAIVNVPSSSLAREAEFVFLTEAGSEIAVASTKAFTAQCAALYLFALTFCKNANSENIKECLFKIPDVVRDFIPVADRETKMLSNSFKNAKNAFFIGRGIDYPICLEGSLKLKEISYIHSEGFPAGELKHGTLSLIEEGTPVFALATQPSLFDKTISNVKEATSRGAKVILALSESLLPPKDLSAEVFYLPSTHPLLSPFVSAVFFQLLAYNTAQSLSLDPDKPRNLAKSVTVE